MCAVNLRLQHRLPPFPWIHSADEADKVQKLLFREKTPSVNMPREARLLRLHMLINGIFVKYVIASRHVVHIARSQTVSYPAHMSHELITVSLLSTQLGLSNRLRDGHEHAELGVFWDRVRGCRASLLRDGLCTLRQLRGHGRNFVGGGRGVTQPPRRRSVSRVQCLRNIG
jgi:hypothetical protein